MSGIDRSERQILHITFEILLSPHGNRFAWLSRLAASVSWRSDVRRGPKPRTRSSLAVCSFEPFVTGLFLEKWIWIKNYTYGYQCWQRRIEGCLSGCKGWQLRHKLVSDTIFKFLLICCMNFDVFYLNAGKWEGQLLASPM